MKLLLFSDLHADRAAARRLVERARSVDVVIGAGDFGTVRRQVRVCFEVLRAIDKPTVLVAGNNESTGELREACRDWPTANVLHGSGTTIAGVDFFGIGGGIPVTPFGSWSYDFTEEEAEELLKGCPLGCVLVSHSPPKWAVDEDSQGKSLGSIAVRAAVLRLKPTLVVCGHIHASAGMQASLGTTTVINAGPNGVEWEVDSGA
ncbi:MAG TPA: metallophosphoesterase family protein [Gemmataceae bacterium]|jgi:Icc-related predicted phosphoesterase|nr:metallophosphoesterase family protein [Gemmataceae bacterium]